MSRVAVASRSFSHHPELRSRLLARYPQVTFNIAGASLRDAALIEFLRGHDKAIIALETLTGPLFEALPELAVVSKYGVGLDMLDLKAMQRHGVALGWTGGVNRRSVSELVISMAIALLRHVPETRDAALAGDWQQKMGRQISGKVFGLVGCGHVGKDLAVLLNAFECQVLAYDILDFPEFYRDHAVRPVDLDTLLSQSDIVSLHLPLDDTTRNILSADRLSLMKPDAVLINTARGGLVDEAMVLEMLRADRLAAAGFDVLAAEPPEDRALLQHPRVLVTPHIGGSSEEAVLAMGQAAIDGLDSASVPSDAFVRTHQPGGL